MAPKKKPASKRTSLSPRSGSSDGSAAVTRIQAVQSIEEVKAKETELTNEKKKLTEEKAGLTKEEADLLDLVGRLNPLSAVKSELLRAGVAVYSNDTITTVESRIATKLATNQQRSTELARQFDVVGQLLIKNAEQLARLTAVSQPQGPWELNLLIPKGASKMHLRQKVFRTAEFSEAYHPAEIIYDVPDGHAIMGTSPLRIYLHFKTEASAQMMVTRILEILRKYPASELPLGLENAVRPVARTVGKRLYFQDYAYIYPADSPSRDQWDCDMSLTTNSTAAYTTKLSAEDIKRESLVEPTFLGFGGVKAEWAHIKEARYCEPAEKEDSSNRLILDSNNHQLFDGRGGDDEPSLTFFVDGTLSFSPQDDGSFKVPLDAVYSNPAVGQWSSSVFRNCTKVGQSHYRIEITHLQPVSLRKYLNQRHNKVMSQNSSRFAPYLQMD
ncbi:hypothetical protein DIPPA_00069 [Diplonema papillatum]|nr:hypothetical protein DIPPA_00069 [Diplonema papillatum]